MRTAIPLALAGLLAACGPAASPDESLASPASPPDTDVVKGLFADRAADWGLVFRHENGAAGDLHFPEPVGSGAALFDMDGDGDLDVFLVQGTVWQPGGAGAAPTVGRRADLRDRLFRNDLRDGIPRFTDVTESSGLGGYGYGMGVAAGDVDNDGWTDLYVTAFGDNVLWRNRGPDATDRVTFEDVTEFSGAGDSRWSTSATFLDFDRDGWLDLYLTNYVAYRLGQSSDCRSESGRPDYCGPQNFPGEPDRLLRNLGVDAAGRVRFEDVSGAAGIFAEAGSGLGVVSADFDGNGWPDIYVANDLMPNLLWLNQGEGASPTFVNAALLGGCAVNGNGVTEASMGVVAGDVDGDGDEDLFMTHLAGETNTLYLNDGSALFEDRTAGRGLAAESLPFTGFGTVLADFDLDGRLDLAAANGAVRLVESQAAAGDPYPLRQPNLLLANRGDGFEPWPEAGAVFELAEVSRGLAVGDVDNDGDPDLLLSNNRGPARLLVNGGAPGRRWLGLRLVDGRRDGLGARVEVVTTDGRRLLRRADSGGSYASASDPRVLFGLGGAAEVEAIRVTWSDGEVEVFPGAATGSYHELAKGAGREAG